MLKKSVPEVLPTIDELIKRAIETKKLYPEASPSSPSNQLIALVKPTIQKQVIKCDQKIGNKKTISPRKGKLILKLEILIPNKDTANAIAN